MPRASFTDLQDIAARFPVQAAFLLAAIPAVMFSLFNTPGASTPPPSPPLVVRAVMTEGVRAARQDDETFRRRWDTVNVFPPSIEVRYVEAVASAAPGAAPSPPAQKLSRVAVRSEPTLRSKPAKLDLCTRHRMRKVWVRHGRWPSWRCRR
jgi:hypothetical protein